MNKTDLQRLAGFSDSVRDSTLKRLKAVPTGQENFRWPDGAMSFADIADHLIDIDDVFMSLLEARFKGKDLGRAGGKVVDDRHEFGALIQELEILKQRRHEFIVSLNDDMLSTSIPYDMLKRQGDAPFQTLLYWLLDHEIHHRGAMVVYLNTLKAQGFS